MLEPLRDVDTTPLFRPLLGELLALLRRLAPSDWERPTVAGGWRVRDVAAHLLDGDLRRLAIHRDAHAIPPEHPITNARDLARFVNALNASGVAFGTRLSPRLLVELLGITGEWVAHFLASLDRHGPAPFPVSWAGERASENWMDTGREYTERWHHQAQIRDAVGAPRLLEPRWMRPLLELSVRALPHAYASTPVPAGSTVAFVVEGETSGTWTVRRAGERWEVLAGSPPAPDASVVVRTDDAWRLLYNALDTSELARRVDVRGDADLARPLLRARSVIL